MGRKKTTKNKRSNNEGSIYQLPSGRWRCVLSLGYKEDGTRNRPSQTFDTETEAKQWRTQQLATAQEYGAESVKTTSELFVDKYYQWLLDYKMADVYPQTFHRMMREFNNLIKPFFQKLKLRDLLQEDFQRFFNRLETNKVGKETRRKIKGNLHQYFEKEYANTPMRNPLNGIKTETRKKIEILNPEAAFFNQDYKAVPKDVRKQFLNALDKDKNSPFLKPLCYLMYFAGNRVG